MTGPPVSLNAELVIQTGRPSGLGSCANEVPPKAQSAALIRQIADEAGATVGGTLYSDVLASDGPASTYLGMFAHNVDTLMAALTPRGEKRRVGPRAHRACGIWRWM